MGVSMGGQGCGGHNSKGKRRDVQCARLDVHELARKGKLKLGSRGWLFGTIWFEVTGGPNAQHLVLHFPCRSASGGGALLCNGKAKHGKRRSFLAPWNALIPASIRLLPARGA
jgi:hypothetical protein